MESFPEAWRIFLTDTPAADLWQGPLLKTETRRKETVVYPPEGSLFRALRLTPPDRVRAVLLGQDPYHEAEQAEGIAFSVPAGVTFPPSLKNIFREYASDLNRPLPRSGHLGAWAEGGILLLNSILSVDEGKPGSHAKFGWEAFTDGVIAAISAKKEGIVFLLWGAYAQKKRPLIDETKHTVLAGVHPSPLSAYRGFFGSRPFSRTEKVLAPWRWPEL